MGLGQSEGPDMGHVLVAVKCTQKSTVLMPLLSLCFLNENNASIEAAILLFQRPWSRPRFKSLPHLDGLAEHPILVCYSAYSAVPLTEIAGGWE